MSPGIGATGSEMAEKNLEEENQPRDSRAPLSGVHTQHLLRAAKLQNGSPVSDMGQDWCSLWLPTVAAGSWGLPRGL